MQCQQEVRLLQSALKGFGVGRECFPELEAATQGDAAWRWFPSPDLIPGRGPSSQGAPLWMMGLSLGEGDACLLLLGRSQHLQPFGYCTPQAGQAVLDSAAHMPACLPNH